MNIKQRWDNFFSKNAKEVVTKKLDNTEKSGPISHYIGFSKFTFPFQNLEHYYKAYQTIPQLSSIIDKSADAINKSNDSIVQIQKDGFMLPVTSGPLFELMQSPHPLYDWKLFKGMLYRHWQLFDRVHILKSIPAGFGPERVRGLFLLPTPDVYMIAKYGITLNDIIYAKDINEIIDHYELSFDGKIYKFAPEDIITITNGSLQLEDKLTYQGRGNLLYPDEKMKSLKEPLKIIAASYDIELELKYNYGAMGILSPAVKDGMSANIGLSGEDIKDIQKDYLEYGLTADRFKLMIVKKAVDFKPIALPLDNLKLPEGVQKHKITICDRFKFPILLLNELEGSTYSNMDIAWKTLFIDKIIPESDRIEFAFNKQLGLLNTEFRFNFDFSELEVLQKDAIKEAEKNKINTETIIMLNKAVSIGEMSRQSAIFTLALAFKITDKDAADYILEP